MAAVTVMSSAIAINLKKDWFLMEKTNAKVKHFKTFKINLQMFHLEIGSYLFLSVLENLSI